MRLPSDEEADKDSNFFTGHYPCSLLGEAQLASSVHRRDTKNPGTHQ